jgi:hypothetical protein
MSVPTKTRHPAFDDLHERTTPAPVTKKVIAVPVPTQAAVPTLGRPLGESVRVLVKYILVIFLTLISFAVDGPVSWWGFEELTIALQRVTGYAWNAPADVKWYFWLFVTVISTLSLAHFTLNWREYGRGLGGMVRGLLFVLFILVPSQAWDFIDSLAGVYGLFQPIDLMAVNVPLVYISIAAAVFGSFVAPTFALLLAREGTNEQGETEDDNQTHAD